LKLHRLGRVSFRKVKDKRDYLEHRRHGSWLYLSRLAALKEYAFMDALYGAGFPVPKPLDSSRHCILMTKVQGYPLVSVRDIDEAQTIYERLEEQLVRLARCGLIHGDFNEFNIMVGSDGTATIIDFPQMVSTSHINAAMYFERDSKGLADFFAKRYGVDISKRHTFADILAVEPEDRLDVKIRASGFDETSERHMEALLRAQRQDDHEDDDEGADEADRGEEEGGEGDVPEQAEGRGAEGDEEVDEDGRGGAADGEGGDDFRVLALSEDVAARAEGVVDEAGDTEVEEEEVGDDVLDATWKDALQGESSRFRFAVTIPDHLRGSARSWRPNVGWAFRKLHGLPEPAPRSDEEGSAEDEEAADDQYDEFYDPDEERMRQIRAKTEEDARFGRVPDALRMTGRHFGRGRGRGRGGIAKGPQRLTEQEIRRRAKRDAIKVSNASAAAPSRNNAKAKGRRAMRESMDM
jgi:serine/threonine-protein kinase RIO1